MIRWTEYALNSHEIVRQWETHTGLVVGPTHREERRVMSDIYADVTSVRVWNPEKGTTEWIETGVHFELCHKFGSAVVDAPPEILLRVAEMDAAAERAREERRIAEAAAERQRIALYHHNRPVVGKRMRVTRGRKVPVGTVGEVFWVRDGRVGLNVTGRKDARGWAVDPAWIDAAYLENVEPFAS